MAKDLKILYLSSFPPRECGIATFCEDVIKAVYNLDYNIHQRVISVEEIKAPERDYPSEVRYHLFQEELKSYENVALYVNESGADIFCLQHENGLFGGFDGIFILKLLEKIKKPIISFFHTIPALEDVETREYRLKILARICKFSKRIIVTGKIGKRVLTEECKIPENKIVTIYHGAPDIPYPSKNEKERLKEKFNLKDKVVMSNFGLFCKGKGLEFGVEAMVNLSKKYPNLIFLILGRFHPLYKKEIKRGCYHSNFQKRIENLNIKNNILFINRFLDEEELINYLRLTDIYLIPYQSRSQISSGTLAYAMATGNCVVSTPFLYAKELIGKDRGYFIDFESSDSIVKVVSDLMENPEKIEKAQRKAYDFGRKFTWPEVARKYFEVFRKAIGE